MKLAVPIAVKFLHRGNRELSRNLSSYLSLAAINNAEVLAPHIQPIIDSIISGNYILARVLVQIYSVNKEPIHDHMMALVSLLPQCENADKISLLNLFNLIAKYNPMVLEEHLPQLSHCLTNSATAHSALQIFLDMGSYSSRSFPEHLAKIKISADLHSGCISLAACLIGQIGKLSLARGQECVDFLVAQLEKSDHSSILTILRMIKGITDVYPNLLNGYIDQITEFVEPSKTATVRIYLQQLRADALKSHQTPVNQIQGGITIVKVSGGSRSDLVSRPPSLHRKSAKSLGSLHTVNRHTGSIIHQSRSTVGIHASSVNRSLNGIVARPHLNARLTSGGVTVMTPQKSISGSMPTLHEEEGPLICTEPLGPSSATIIASPRYQGGSGASNPQRVSVFEPYPMRDTVQHFSEKHLDKIKAYMTKVFVKIPLPVKCTIEERKYKKHAKLYFCCQGKGPHCLYKTTYFGLKTCNPRVWIHLMFLALQARATSALSTREQSVGSLKNCWDILKATDNKSFLTLVTSAFPSMKDHDALILELRHNRFFDVFEYNGPLTMWGCFLCNHPDRAMGFLQDSEPVIEGQLKEKKGKWKLFKRWRTHYFTLSGAHLTYRNLKKGEKDGQPIEVSQIRSVRAISSRRNIPKAFEIFTNDKTFVFKAKDSKNTEQWVQCLSIAMARSQAKDII